MYLWLQLTFLSSTALLFSYQSFGILQHTVDDVSAITCNASRLTGTGLLAGLVGVRTPQRDKHTVTAIAKFRTVGVLL